MEGSLTEPGDLANLTVRQVMSPNVMLEGEAAGPPYTEGPPGLSMNGIQAATSEVTGAGPTGQSFLSGPSGRLEQRDIETGRVVELEHATNPNARAHVHTQGIPPASQPPPPPPQSQQQQQQPERPPQSEPHWRGAENRAEVPGQMTRPAPSVTPSPVGGSFEYQEAMVLRGPSGQGHAVQAGEGVNMAANISPPEELPSAFASLPSPQAVWMMRLGEFFQRRVSQATAFMERQGRVQGPRTIPPAPQSWSGNTPLFTPEENERTHQRWQSQAPLLHGPRPVSVPREAESSSGSLTQEQVMAEVNKQVRIAMEAHSREYKLLEKENEQLRKRLEDGLFSRAAPVGPDTSADGNPSGTRGGGVNRDEELRGEIPGGLSGGPGGFSGNVPGRREGDVHQGEDGPRRDEGPDRRHRGRENLRGEDPGLLEQGHVHPTGEAANPMVGTTATVEKNAFEGPKGLEPGHGKQENASGRSADPIGMLAQGMVQLQTTMTASLSRANNEVEVVKPGITELPKLADLTETSCLDIGDWLHALECPMGDISNTSSVWWRGILSSLDEYYKAYLESSNMGKLALKVENFASPLVKEPRWSRVDKRATSMLLASVPETVRAEALAMRLTGALQVLGRILVLYRPGSSAERQQILKALEAPTPSTNAPEAVEQLRKWTRWLRRSEDVGLKSPDASILLRGLDSLVRKPLQDHAEIAFRVNILRYQLEVDTKPTQSAIMNLHSTLLSEFEQVAFKGRGRAGTSVATMKGLSMPTAGSTPSTTTTAGTGGEPDGAKGRASPCKFFLTDNGCRRGIQPRG